jgi:quinol monooxygenase YgiN
VNAPRTTPIPTNPIPTNPIPNRRNPVLSLEPMDQYVSHETQLADDRTGPVVLVNVFHVPPDRGDELADFWAGILRRFKDQPGFISAQFHRGTAGSGTFLNYAVWESTAHYRAAFGNPEFQALLDGYPEGTVATPHLFAKVAVPDVCIA